MADEVRLIDAKLLTTNIAQIAKNCARSDAQKALIGRILFMIENMPTIEAEPVVRCKDCKYRQDDDFCGGRGCPAQLVPDDGYCDRGARMDGDSDDEP